MHVYLLCEHMCLHTRFTLSCHSRAPAPRTVPVHAKCSVSIVGSMTLIAQKVKRHMVTKVLNTKLFSSKWSIQSLTGSDSQPRTILSPGGHWALSGEVSGYHSWGGPTGTSWVKAWDVAKHRLKHRTAILPPNRISPCPKCQ